MALLDSRTEKKVPSEKERLNSSVKWFEILLPNYFKIFFAILFGTTT